MSLGPKLSIIIPVLGEEPQLDSLVNFLEIQLDLYDISSEILLSLAPRADYKIESLGKKAQLIWSPQLGRSHQFNFASEKATGEWLLFLHADSKLYTGSILKLSQLLHSFEANDKSLFYFWLHFLSDGPAACWFNARFANLRSKYFGLPFGDQGFLVKRESFHKLGAFPSHFVSGEDHAFVQKAKNNGFSIKPINAWIQTSARKYKKAGWFSVTAKHLFLTAKQELLREETR